MKHILATGVSALISLVATTATAQDLMADAGSVTRSYNYVEGFYLLNLENDLPENAEVDLPLLLRISVDLNEQFSLYGEYVNQSYTLTDLGFDASFDIESYGLTLRYRDTLHIMANTDWVAGVGLSHAEFEITADTESIGDGSDFFTTYLGLRRTITQRLEGELGINFSRATEGGSFSGTGDAALIYRVSPRLDIALGGNSLSDGDNYGIGLRYTWN